MGLRQGTAWTSHQFMAFPHRKTIKDRQPFTLTQSYRQFRVPSSPHIHVVWLWKEAREPGENPQGFKHTVNMQTAHRKAPGRDRTHDLLALRRPLHHLVTPGKSCRVIVYKWVAFHTSNLHSWSTGFLGSRTVLADRPRNHLASPPLMGFPPRKHKSHTYWWTVKEMVPSVSYWSSKADVQSCWLHLGICCYFGDCYMSSWSHLLSRIVTCILDRQRALHTLSPGSALPDSLGLHWLVAGWSHVSCTASSWCSHLGKYTPTQHFECDSFEQTVLM